MRSVWSKRILVVAAVTCLLATVEGVSAVASRHDGGAVAAKKRCKKKKGAGSAKKCRKHHATPVTPSPTPSPPAPSAAMLGISATAHAYGPVAVGANSDFTFTISNIGGTPTGVPSVTTSGPNASDFAIFSNGCTSAIPVSGNCDVTIRFSPGNTGNRNASLAVSASPGGSVGAELSGSGYTAAHLSISPTSHDFFSVMVGNTADFQFEVTNTGTQPSGTPLVLSLAGPDISQFSIVSGSSNCGTYPGSGNCTITVRFSPTSTGMKTASLNVTASPGGSPSADLFGTGS